MKRRAFLGSVAAVVAACSRTARRALAPTSVPTTSAPAAPPPTHAAGPATFVRTGPSTSSGIALTFHTSTDSAVVASLLDQANSLACKLTFFVVGTWASSNPTLLARIQSSGHDVGNHTWSHIDLPHLGQAAMFDEIDKCASVLQRQTGSIGRWFRPSQTDVPTDAILDAAGRVGYATSVGYDIDPLDYQNPGAAAVLHRTRDALHPGAIVSLHTLYPGTADAFGDIVRAARARGLEPVTLSTLLQ